MEIWNRALVFSKSFLKWVLIAALVGGISGAVGTLFRVTVEHANLLWQANRWLVFLLPAGGLLIAGLYRLAKMESSIGTDRVIRSVRAESSVPVRLGPLIFISTAITHLLFRSGSMFGVVSHRLWYFLYLRLWIGNSNSSFRSLSGTDPALSDRGIGRMLRAFEYPLYFFYGSGA